LSEPPHPRHRARQTGQQIGGYDAMPGGSQHAITSFITTKVGMDNRLVT